MIKFRYGLLGLLAFVLLVSLSTSAVAQPQFDMAPPTKQATSKPYGFHPIADALSQELQKVLGATTTVAAPPSDENSEFQTDAGTNALDLALNFLDALEKQGVASFNNFDALPQINVWLELQYSDQHLRDRWTTIGQDMLFVVGLSFFGAWFLELIMLPARRQLRRRQPATLVGKLGGLAGWLGLEIMPALLFVGASLMLLDQQTPTRVVRLVVLNVVYAITLSRFVMLAIRALLAPRAPGLRLFAIATPTAVYFYRWLAVYSFVLIFGYFCIDVARLVHVPQAALDACGNLLGFVIVVMTIIVIVQKRAFVSVLLRGQLSAAKRDLSIWQNLRLWFARTWHVLAIGYLLLGYLITAFGVDGGINLMLRGTILSVLILVLMLLLLHNIAARDNKSSEPGLHHPILLFLARLFVVSIAIVTFLAAWGADVPALFATPFGQRIVKASLSIGITVALVTVLYETFSSAVERHLNRQNEDGTPLQVSGRIRTILPMARNTVLLVFSVIVGLVVLSEMGINIGPFLAGASVIGVAIGFGSQTLAKDFITGLFIVMENAISIGDVVKIGDYSGVVEALTVRTVRLRDSDGAMHILPFSEVTKITNMTKGHAYALINVGVSYSSNLRQVMEVMRAVGEDLQKDPVFRKVILAPMEVFGVDKLGDSSITISARIRTRPGKQWDVKRMLLLLLKERFDKEGIELPFPTVTNIQKVEIEESVPQKDGSQRK